MSGGLDIAFCIFGQLRDDHLHLPGIARLADEVGATVFFSTWRTRGTKTSGVINRDQLIRMFGYTIGCAMPPAMVGNGRFNAAVPEFEARLQTLFRENLVTTEQLTAHFPAAVIDIEDEVMALDFPAPVPIDRNSLRMLYKVWRCNELKRAAERQRGKRFDIVVRFRPDVLPELDPAALAALCAEGAKPTALYHHGKPGATYLADVIVVSTSPVADRLAGLFGDAMRHPTRQWSNIHNEIPRHMDELGITAGEVKLQRWILEDFASSQPRNSRHLLDLLAQDRVNPATFARSGAGPGVWPAVRGLLNAAAAVQEKRPRDAVEHLVAMIALDRQDADFLGRAAFVLCCAYQQARVAAHRVVAHSIEAFASIEARGEAALRDQRVSNGLRAVHGLAGKQGMSEPGTWRALERMLLPAIGVPVLRRLLEALGAAVPPSRRLLAERMIAGAMPELFAPAEALDPAFATALDLAAGDTPQAALEPLAALAAAHPARFEPLACLGDLHLALHDPEAARGAYRTAACMAGARADLHAMVSLCCQTLGDAAGAIEAVRQAVAGAPDNVIFRLRLAALLSEHGEHEAAGPVWQEACRRLPMDPAMLHALGCRLERTPGD
jgi:thioredoxin-like negative regulator of GroEL